MGCLWEPPAIKIPGVLVKNVGPRASPGCLLFLFVLLLSVWLSQVWAEARGIFGLYLQHTNSYLRRVGPSSLTRDRTPALGVQTLSHRATREAPPGHLESGTPCILIINSLSLALKPVMLKTSKYISWHLWVLRVFVKQSPDSPSKSQMWHRSKTVLNYHMISLICGI